MSLFVSIDENGFPTGFYDEAIYPPTIVPATTPKAKPTAVRNTIIPSDATEVSQADWNKLSTGLYVVVAGTAKLYVPPVISPTEDAINDERDRRMYGGFVFQSHVFQTDAPSIANITGAAQLAFMAIVGGAKAGDMMWSGGAMPFVWIAADNTFVQMDAQTVVTFAKAAAAFRSQMIYMARSMKNALASGQQPDIYADASWGVDATSPTSTVPPVATSS